MKPVLGTKATTAAEAIAALAGSVRDPLELLEEVRARIGRVVPNHGGAWMVTDPQTVMPMSVLKDGQSSPEFARRYFEHEFLVPDFAPFVHLHRDGVVATTLMRATGGRPELSQRYREIVEPTGHGPELRMLFRTGTATWGMTCVSRDAGDPDFDDDELAWLRTIAPHVGRGLRDALARPPAEPSPLWAPGMLVLRDDGSIEYKTGDAERWLGAMPMTGDYELPPTVVAVALQARAEALAATPAYETPAQARVRLDTGVWLYVHAAALRDATGAPSRTAVMLEPADRSQLLPLLVRMHGLTEREREVTEFVLAGLPTEEIAQRMSISRYTVRDHFKAIFAKVGVASRPELTARFLPDLG
jgi:DNA-binding CsgD family transcriptional regulator